MNVRELDSIVTFKWHRPGYRSTFTSEHVNISQRSFARHYKKPHRYICITDDPVGLDSKVEYVPLWDTFADIPNPTWPQGPSCYRRLLTFGKDFAKIAGERFLCVDIDLVVVNDVTPLIEREEDFVIWDTGNPRIPYCASMYLMTAGSKSEVLDRFNPACSPQLSVDAGYRGSDQAWINYCLGKDIPTWGMADGVYSWRDHLVKKFAHAHILPGNARVIIFHGRPDPWEPYARAASPWIEEHYL